MDHLVQKFIDETNELLEELEEALLVLEKQPDNSETIGRVFRSLHTIKGSSAMFGYESISHFTHDVEDVYEMVRNGKLVISKVLIDATLKSIDCIQNMLEHPKKSYLEKNDTAMGLMHLFKSYLSGPAQVPTIVPQNEETKDNEDTVNVYRVVFKPEQDIFLFGTNPLFLLEELKELGQTEIIAHTENIPPLSDIDIEACYLFWDILITTDKGRDAIRDVFIFVEDNCQLEITKLDFNTEDSKYKKLGEILVGRGEIPAESCQEILNTQKKMGELLVENKVVTEETIESALVEQKVVKEIQSVNNNKQKITSLRVPLGKLDNLVDLVGELVTSAARLNDLGHSAQSPELRSLSEDVDRLISELRDSALNIRMMPIGTLFSKFNRLVRDLSSQLGKNIEFTTSGADTELDKAVIEKLNDPLVHLIRNCIDHGIEMPGSRIALGKNETGKIRLSAQHAGTNVIIKIVDDGAGMNKQAIISKAVQNGLITEGTGLSDQEAWALIFKPGFSTAETITNISGRGVGLDVVKKAIEELRGTITIESTKEKGTSMIIKLPLTLAIIDGLHVRVADESYIIPLSMVVECIEFTEKDRQNRNNFIELRGEMLPFISLRSFFKLNVPAMEYEHIVVVHNNGRRVGIMVDEVSGQYQTVIKSLGKLHQNVEGISGATILGNGQVALILDINSIEKIALAEQQKQYIS